MREIKYTEEIYDFIKENAHKGSYWLEKEIYRNFKIKICKRYLTREAYRRGVQVKVFTHGWNYYMVEYLVSLNGKYYFPQMVELLNEKFNCQKKRFDIINLFKRQNIKFIYPPIEEGNERKAGRHIQVYVNGSYIDKSRYIYEKHYGEIPKG